LQGDEYKMTLEYAQGLATVNGLPMPVPIPGIWLSRLKAAPTVPIARS